MRNRFAAILLSVSLAQGITDCVEAYDWPQFLGPNRTGISADKGLLDQWPAAGPAVRWKVPGGVGMSAVAVSQGKAITTWNADQGQVVAALDAATGQEIWKTRLAPRYENGQGDGPRATPTIASDSVYAYTGEGILACLDLASGKSRWSADLPQRIGVRPAEYGMACSPLVFENAAGDPTVVVTVGGRGTAVVAVDGRTGTTRWSAGNGAPGYSSPALLTIEGETQVVAFTGDGVSGLDPESGAVQWDYPFKTPYDCNTATPISVDGNVFISAGENHGCVMLRITKRGGVYQVTERWESTEVKSVMRNEWQTAALVDGHLFGFDNVGSAGPITHLTCVRAEDGKVMWRQTRFGKGNLVAADGHLWITTMSGEVVLARATPQRYDEIGRARLIGKTRQTPSIANGRAFLRDDENVICLDITDPTK